MKPRIIAADKHRLTQIKQKSRFLSAFICVHLRLIVFASVALSAHAAMDGTVMNGTTGKPQPGATVTLYKVGGNGPEAVQSVKSDAEGKFAITQDIPGPRLLQAAFDGVTYNKMVPPGMPASGLMIEVYKSVPKPGDARVDQHIVVLEPAADGRMTVSESYVWANNGKTTFNDPENGTLQFYLPPAANGEVTVNVLAPQGMPIRRAPDKTAAPDVYKVDFPIKPGESRVDLTYAMNFTSPGEFVDKVLYHGGPTRFFVPPGVTLSGEGLQSLGTGPMNASVYSTEATSIRAQVTGTGSLRGQQEQNAGGGEGQMSQIMPKVYGAADPKAGFRGAIGGVKWILVLTLAILSLGFTLLYRAGTGKV